MKGYRTLIFAILLAIFGAVLTALPMVQQQIPPAWYGWLFMAVGAVVGVLRAVTDSPIFKKWASEEGGS